MTTASPYRFFSLSRRRPRRHADETRLADKAIRATKELPPLIKCGARPDHEEGRVKFENKKTVHAKEVRRAPLKPHLHAAARSTTRYSPRKGL
jgi:hypothetical protein